MKNSSQNSTFWALIKFKEYILGFHLIIYTNHAIIKYLMVNKDAKPRLHMGVIAARV